MTDPRNVWRSPSADLLSRLSDLAPSVDRQGAFPSESLRLLADAGYFGLTVPKEYGGLAASAKELSNILSDVGTRCGSSALILLMHVTSVSAIVHYGSQSTKNRFLPRIAAGELLVTEAISEPQSGSQWWSINSSATPLDGGGYELDVAKSWATAAGFADLYIVSTRSPGADNPRDHSLFLVAPGDGTTSVGSWNGLGLRGNMSTSFTFKGSVSEDGRLATGENGEGLRQYNEINQPIYHIGLASVYLGIGNAAFEAAKAHVSRRSFQNNPAGYGNALAGYPIIRRRFGKMYGLLASLRATIERLADRIDEGEAFEKLALDFTALKFVTAETVSKVTQAALKACGGAAYVAGRLAIERHVRDALAASLMGPNDDFCKEAVGRMVLEGASYHDL